MHTELQGRSWYVNLSSGINMAKHINVRTPMCTFYNNLHLVHERAIRRITKYLARMSTYVDLPDGNWWLTICDVVYRTDIEKVTECCADADLSGGWAQVDADNAENVTSTMGYVIIYAGCPVLWCSKLQTEIALSTTEVGYTALIQEIHKSIPFMELMKEVSIISNIHLSKPEVFVKYLKTIKVVLISWNLTNYHQEQKYCY